ncbi:MAG: HAD-IA family hydrolase [Anaerolineae bacterium]|nr:HAD-IA family hydrolase [Anaerolineae bacterium]
MSESKVKALFVDFNDTISPSNFIQSFSSFEDQTGWTGKQLGKAYIEAELLNQLMCGLINEHEFWIGVSNLTHLPLEILLQYAQIIRKTKELDLELVEMLMDCKKYSGIVLILLTDNVHEMFADWERKFHLRDYFDYIVNSADCGMTKKDEGIYHLALKMVGVNAPEALLIDDDENYLDVAKSIGFETIHFLNRERLSCELTKRSLLPVG